MQTEVLTEVLAYIDDHICEKISLAELAQLAGYSPFYFSSLFSKAMGMSVTGYIRIRKLQYAICSLLEGKRVLDVSLMYAFDSHEGFTRSFTQLFGSTPTKAKKYLSHYQAPDYIVPNTVEKESCIMKTDQNDLQENLHQIIFTVIKTSLEEVKEGHGTEFRVSLLPDGNVKISDNGRGIPLSENEKVSNLILDRILSGKPITSVEYAQMGDFSKCDMQTVNSLCESLQITVYREGYCYKQDYVRGIVQHDLICRKCEHDSGTEIVLKPDGVIFGNQKISLKELEKLICQKAEEEYRSLVVFEQ